MQTSNIVVIGSANIDLVTRVPRAPKPGESIIGHSFATITGGKGANQAIAAARLGARVAFVGCVGNDAFGAQQRASLEAAGVDTAHLKVDPEQPTGTAVILVADEGQNSIVVTPAANYGLRPEDLEPLSGLIAAADAVLLQLEIPLETVEAALEMARDAGVVSILDAGPAQAVAPTLLSKATIISPNETEAEALTGLRVDSMESARSAARQLLEEAAAVGPQERAVVLKLGAQGCYYLSGSSEHRLPAFTITAVDTTAAGDAFTAALAVAWGEGDIPAALRFANAAGALAATVHGAQPSMPARARVEAFLAGAA